MKIPKIPTSFQIACMSVFLMPFSIKSVTAENSHQVLRNPYYQYLEDRVKPVVDDYYKLSKTEYEDLMKKGDEFALSQVIHMKKFFSKDEQMKWLKVGVEQGYDKCMYYYGRNLVYSDAVKKKFSKEGMEFVQRAYNLNPDTGCDSIGGYLGDEWIFRCSPDHKDYIPEMRSWFLEQEEKYRKAAKSGGLLDMLRFYFWPTMYDEEKAEEWKALRALIKVQYKKETGKDCPEHDASC